MFYNVNYKTGGLNEGINEGLNEGLNGGLKEGIKEGLKEGINSAKNRHLNIIDLIKSNSTITIKELQNILGVSESTLDRDVAMLKKQNKIKRVGSKKSGHWELL